MQAAQPQARWLYPAEIERVLAAHPAMALVAVGRQPDPVKGEIANAYVVLKKGAACDEAEMSSVGNPSPPTSAPARCSSWAQRCPASPRVPRRRGDEPGHSWVCSGTA